MPKDNPPRWITIEKAPYDYRWPDRPVVTCFKEPGEYLVKAEIADDAVNVKKVAREGKLDGSEAKSPKGKRERKKKTTPPPAKGKTDADATASDIGTNAGVDGAGVPAPDSADVRSAVDPATE